MPPLQAMFQPVMKVTGIDTDSDRFRIKAASGGFLAKLLGMGTASSLTMDATGLRLKKSTFGGEEHTFIPRHQIASTVYVVQKPLELLILGLMTLIMLVGIVFLIVYFFFSKKRVIVGVISSGGTVESLKLKATEDDLADIKAGMAVVEQLLQLGVGAAPTPARTEELPAAPSRAHRSFIPPAPPAPPPPPPPPAAAGGT
ncbi:MAG TPA: hypothetical protein VMZ71_16465, partial [Gemmataceae bacterium]|nr:hypothetical protein [Gemmataceae bacterium]